MSAGLLLTVDVGNTNTVLGVHEGEDIKAHWRLATRREQTTDEYGILVRNLFASSGLATGSLGGGIARQRGPAPDPGGGRRCAARISGSTPWWSSRAYGRECRSSTSLPATWAPTASSTALRRSQHTAGPVIVVDFGTATTFDVVSRKGEYVGGVICPGIGISADALFQRAARLPRVDVRNPGHAIGRSTVTSIQSGLYFGYASMVEGIIGRIAAELKERPRVVATGGLAETLAREIPSIEAVDPVLTLTGLRLIWERNRPADPV